MGAIATAAVTTAAETFLVVGDARYPVPPHGLRVGRAPDNDVVLADPNVSRQHLIVWTTPRGAFLRDLGSQNGTYIGSRRLGPGPEALAPGIPVRAGRSELLIERGARAGARPVATRKLAPLLGILAIAVAALLGLTVFRAATATPSAGAPSVSTAGEQPGASPAAEAGAQAPMGRDPGLVRALGAAVQVIVRMESGQISIGSGTVVTPRGHVLTSYHVVGDNATGRPRNPTGDVIIAVPPEEGAPAQPKFVARALDADPGLDFAVLRLISTAGGGPLPANPGLTPIPVGDSDTVRIGDGLTIVGYPGLGGQGVTVTRGIHSGIQSLRGEAGTFFKTDTEINPGNSGGTAMNAAGELVGVPTAGVTNRSATGKLGLVRPINQARPMLERASQDP